MPSISLCYAFSPQLLFPVALAPAPAAAHGASQRAAPTSLFLTPQRMLCLHGAHSRRLLHTVHPPLLHTLSLFTSLRPHCPSTSAVQICSGKPPRHTWHCSQTSSRLIEEVAWRDVVRPVECSWSCTCVARLLLRRQAASAEADRALQRGAAPAAHAVRQRVVAGLDPGGESGCMQGQSGDAAISRALRTDRKRVGGARTAASPSLPHPHQAQKPAPQTHCWGRPDVQHC